MDLVLENSARGPGLDDCRPDAAGVRLAQGHDPAAAARRRVEPAGRPAARGRAPVAARVPRHPAPAAAAAAVRRQRHQHPADRHRDAAHAAHRAVAPADGGRPEPDLHRHAGQHGGRRPAADIRRRRPPARPPGGPPLRPLPPRRGAAGTPVRRARRVGAPQIPPGSSPIPGTTTSIFGTPAAAHRRRRRAARCRSRRSSRQPPPRRPSLPRAGSAPAPTAPAGAGARTPPGNHARLQRRPPPAVVLVSPPGTEFRVGGGPYLVPISISALRGCRRVSLSLTFNPAVLRVRTVQEGSLMRQGGVQATFTQKVDAAGGRVDIAVVRRRRRARARRARACWRRFCSMRWRRAPRRWR